MTKVQDPRAQKTRVQAAKLRSALKDVNAIVEGRNTIPILDCVLLRVDDQRITVTATDLDHCAIRDCASDDRDGPDSAKWLAGIRGFAVCLPAKRLEAVLGEFDGDAMVTVEIDPKSAGRVIVKAGRARFSLPTLPIDDFPLVEHVDTESEFELSCSQLSDALACVDHAISSEETRYYLNGVFLHPVGLDLRFATTDGSRLARWRLDGPVGSTSFPGVIVSRKSVEVLEKLLASAIKAKKDDQGEPPHVLIEVGGEGRWLRFSMPAEGGGDVEVVAKTIDGQFPDYDRVIPPSPPHCAVIDRSALASAVKRVAVLVDVKSRAVRFGFTEGLLTLSVHTPELGEAVEELPCHYLGPDFELGLNSKFVREALGAIGSDNVALRFDADAGAAVRIVGWENEAEVGALLQILMPVRV